MTVVIYYDGTPSGWVCTVRVNGTPKGPVLRGIPEVLHDVNLPEGFVSPGKNQRAEYVALIFALLQIDNYAHYKLIGDNENVTLQMQGINRTRSGHMVTLNQKAHDIINTRGLSVEFKHVHRAYNHAGVELDRYMRRR